MARVKADGALEIYKAGYLQQTMPLYANSWNIGRSGQIGLWTSRTGMTFDWFAGGNSCSW